MNISHLATFSYMYIVHAVCKIRPNYRRARDIKHLHHYSNTRNNTRNLPEGRINFEHIEANADPDEITLSNPLRRRHREWKFPQLRLTRDVVQSLIKFRLNAIGVMAINNRLRNVRTQIRILRNL